jgi:hypothetical protein
VNVETPAVAEAFLHDRRLFRQRDFKIAEIRRKAVGFVFFPVIRRGGGSCIGLFSPSAA